MVILMFTFLKMPISSTYVFVSSLTGLGFAKGVKQVDILLYEHVVFAWFITLPITGLIAFAAAMVI
jgi:PiT family inorganic phosphate transporter